MSEFKKLSLGLPLSTLTSHPGGYQVLPSLLSSCPEICLPSLSLSPLNLGHDIYDTWMVPVG